MNMNTNKYCKESKLVFITYPHLMQVVMVKYTIVYSFGAGSIPVYLLPGFRFV